MMNLEVFLVSLGHSLDCVPVVETTRMMMTYKS